MYHIYNAIYVPASNILVLHVKTSLHVIVLFDNNIATRSTRLRLFNIITVYDMKLLYQI